LYAVKHSRKLLARILRHLSDLSVSTRQCQHLAAQSAVQLAIGSTCA